jgi:hypothetical protein
MKVEDKISDVDAPKSPLNRMTSLMRRPVPAHQLISAKCRQRAPNRPNADRIGETAESRFVFPPVHAQDGPGRTKFD